MKGKYQRNVAVCTATGLTAVLFFASIACKTTHPDYIRDTKGNLVPNLAKCARQNFPEFAKDFVEQAVVATRVSVDKQGIVLSVEPLKVKFPPHVDMKTADMLAPTFKSSAVLSLKGQACPILVVANEPQSYSIDFLLEYSNVARIYTSVGGSAIEPSGDIQPWR